MRLMPAMTRLVVSRLGWLFAAGDERDAEILALRPQVLVLQRQVARPAFTETDRTVLAVLSTAFDRARLRDVFLIAQPATVIAWHRRFVARRWTQPATPRRGRPPVHAEIRRLAVRMARENPTWGYRRIHGELSRLGHKVAPSSVWKTLRDAGINPTPNRTGPSWAQFIRTRGPGGDRHRLLLRRHRHPPPPPRPVLHRDRNPTRSWTAPSSGTNANSAASWSTTSSTTTATAPTAPSTSVLPTTRETAAAR